MKAIVPTVKLDGLDTRSVRFFSDRFTDEGCSIAITRCGELIPQGFVASARTGKSLACFIVYKLATKMLERTKNAQARLFCRAAYFVANLKATPLPPFLYLFVLIHLTTVGFL